MTKLSGVRILVVDDEAMLCEIFQELLENEGALVTTCNSIGEAQRHLGSGRFEIVISDQRMPHGEGLELLEHMRKGNDQTPFILCTGFVNLPIRPDLRPDALVAKPFQSEALVSLVTQLSRGKKHDAAA